MTTYPIADRDDAYANAPHIDEGFAYPERWVERARILRDELAACGRAKIDLAYGPAPRNRLDIFYPDGACKGLVVFVHGGYWKAFDKSFWSHLARGSLSHGYAVAMPATRFAPTRGFRTSRTRSRRRSKARKRDSRRDSALRPFGGRHLATRMICQGSPLSGETAQRITRTVSISGLHDLRPFMATKNERDPARR